jgi:uncharacterized protein (TIGR02266 family)
MTSRIRDDQEPRVSFDGPVAILPDGAPVPFGGRALNLSRGGIFVTAARLFPRGARLEISFTLPGEGEPVEARACVMRQIGRNSELEAAGMALRFEELGQPSAERIEQFVARQAL